MLPSPVKLSIALSDISNDDALLAMMLPNTSSVVAGAVENTSTESGAIPIPDDGEAESCGCCKTPLIEITNCDARVTLE